MKMHPTEAKVLATLLANPSQSVTSLARAVNRSRRQIMRVIKKLEDKGLLEVIRTPGKRSTYIPRFLPETGDMSPDICCYSQLTSLNVQEKDKLTETTYKYKTLVTCGVTSSAAAYLAARYPAERIEEVCQEAQRRNLRNPGGWIYRALTEGWQFSYVAADGGQPSEGTLPPDGVRSYQLLVALGVHENIALYLASKYPQERVELVCRHARSNGKIRHPGAWAVRALVDDYQLPPLPPPSPEITAALTSLGFTPEIAEELAWSYPPERLRAAIRYAPLVLGLGETAVDRVLKYLAQGGRA